MSMILFGAVFLIIGRSIEDMVGMFTMVDVFPKLLGGVLLLFGGIQLTFDLVCR